MEIPYFVVEMGCARTILVFVLMDGRVQNVNFVEEKSGEMDVSVRNLIKDYLFHHLDLKTSGLYDGVI